jgi:hypothetical protein
VLLIGTPDGLDVINVPASILIAIALVPCGIQLIREQQRESQARGARG